MTTSRRSSVSSGDSDTHNAVISMSKRWTTLETVGRCMFLFSVAFFVVGVLITVFGFSNTGIDHAQQVPLQILGPACLAMTIVMWVVGCIFSRLWNLEWKRQQQAIELRDRVQLHALAMDILNNPVLSPGMLQDPRLRRQLLLKLRAQRALDISSNDGGSRRTSRTASVVSGGRRISNAQYEKLVQQEMERRKSMKSEAGDDKQPPFELPGIQISRFETLDYGDGRSSIASGSAKGSKRYIIIHSDVASDFSRLSCPSDYSLAGSRSSRSRSSRASSGVSSRLWDFSPRESEWDADVSLGSRESQLSVLKQDWGGGPSDPRDEYGYSPHGPRKLSVVTFDMGSPTLRRHSSPAYAASMRRKESGCECTCRQPIDSPYHKRFSEDLRIPSSLRKKSADHSCCRSMSIRIDEGEHDDIIEETTPLREEEEKEENKESTATAVDDDRKEYNIDTNVGAERRERLRPPLKRNNTDDSEVERRVNRLFKEIEYSLTDSVDESKIQSCSSDHDYMYTGRKVEAREVEVQTLDEDELRFLMESNNFNMGPSRGGGGGGGARKSNLKDRHRDSATSAGCCSDNMRASIDSMDHNLNDNKVPKKEKKSKLAAISSALASFGLRSLSSERKPKNIPRRLLMQGLSTDDKDIEAAYKTSPRTEKLPPAYEDTINKNVVAQ